jgi:hypothetical protein
MHKLIVCLFTLALATDVSGTWRGSVTVRNPDGTTRDFPAMMVLKQSGSNVTGWTGDSENDQNPIVKGTQVEDKLTLVFVRAGFTLTMEATINKDRIVGTGSRNDGLRFTVQFSR